MLRTKVLSWATAHSSSVPHLRAKPLGVGLLPPSVQGTVGPGIKVTIPWGRGGGEQDPHPTPDSPRPVLLVVLPVAAALGAEALGCQRLLVPLQLLPLQLPDSRADAAPLSQVQRCLQLGATGSDSAPAPATAAPSSALVPPRAGLPTHHTMGPSVQRGPRTQCLLPGTAWPRGERAWPP